MPNAEGLSPFEHDLLKNNERQFRETLNVIAEHAEAVVIETGERDGEPFTDFLFVLRTGSHSPESLHQTQVTLGLDSEVKALVTTGGSGVIVNAGVSEGRIQEIMAGAEELKPVLSDELAAVHQRVTEERQQRSLDSIKDVTDAIKAGLGHTFGGESAAPSADL